MVVTAGAFGEATAARLGRDVAEDSYWKRLVDFLRQDVEIREVKLPAGLADLKIGIKYAGPFWIEVRDAVARSHGKLRDHSHSFIRRCVASLSQAEPHSRGTVFILDSLERLSPPMMSQFEEVMNSVLRVLSEYPSFLRIPDCHAIYTVPPYVRLVSLRVAQHYDGVTHVLPAIKVAERGPAPERYRPGVDALITLLDRRIPLAEIFGDRRDLLEQLIVYSGGHVRTFLSFVRDLLKHSLRSGLPPSEKAIEEVVQYYREPARLAVFREYVPVLHKVLENGTLEGMTREERAMVGALMDENLVLCYRNGEGWFEVHPLVRDLVQELAAEIEAEQSP
ncbi:MAG: hypothetical protein GY856_23190 [bacterium]|nr:hypothetical protein [bacterium]